MSMIIKKVKARSIIYSSYDLTIAEVPAVAESAIMSLQKEIQASGLEPVGPVEFIYNGFDGNPATTFELIIAIPIKKRKKKLHSDTLKQKRSKPFRAGTLEHYGTIETIQHSYQSLIVQMNEAGLKPAETCHELYHHWVAYASPENITELQIVLAS